MRLPVRLSFTGQTNASGNAALKIDTLRAHHASFVIAARCQGAASWDVIQNTDPILFGSGDRVLLGPIYVAPRDVITIAVSGAQPLAAIQGALNGVQAETPEELELSPGAPQVAGFTIGIVSGEFQVTDLKVTGLTGAIAPSRYVGAVNGGPPTSGVFLTGDWVVDSRWGILWVWNGTAWLPCGGPGPYQARMYRAAALNVSDTQVLPFDTIDYDPNGNCTTGAAAAYTAPITGRYRIFARTGQDNVASGSVRLILSVLVAGVETRRGLDNTLNNLIFGGGVVATKQINVGQTCQIQTTTVPTGATALDAGSAFTYFEVAWQGPI